MAAPSTDERVSMGIPGLDEILCGGLPPRRLYLVQGSPGVGNTTLALQFLLEGVRRGERCLYVTLSETSDELQSVAESHGLSLDGVSIHELSGGATDLVAAENTLFHPSEIELAETTREILAHIEEVRPERVVFDSLSELRLLAQSPVRYRRQVLALKQFFVGRNCTVLLMDDKTGDRSDQQLQSIAHGVIELESVTPVYGSDRRRLWVQKMRGVKFRGGFHDYSIVRGGLDVTPRLVASEHHKPFEEGLVPSGLALLDKQVGGGLDRGTSALFMGPPGSGKSAIASRYVYAAARRGERSAIFCFDESPSVLLARARALSMPLDADVGAGLVHVQQVDPAELTPGQFAALVQKQVEAGARVIVMDSLNGYMHAMPEAQFLTAQLHELLAYLGQQGILTIMVVAQNGLMGGSMISPVDVTYLADTVVVFRYFEDAGQIRKAISVLKRRKGNHERTIRELATDREKLVIGEPLTQFRGVFTGVPVQTAPSEASNGHLRE